MPPLDEAAPLPRRQMSRSQLVRSTILLVLCSGGAGCSSHGAGGQLRTAGSTGARGGTTGSGGDAGAGGSSGPAGGGHSGGGMIGGMAGTGDLGGTGMAGTSGLGTSGTGGPGGTTGAAASGGAYGGGGGSTGGVGQQPYPMPAQPPPDETGAQLWLRYPRSIFAEPARGVPGARITQVVRAGSSATLQAAQSELVSGLGGLLGTTVPVVERPRRTARSSSGPPGLRRS